MPVKIPKSPHKKPYPEADPPFPLPENVPSKPETPPPGPLPGLPDPSKSPSPTPESPGDDTSLETLSITTTDNSGALVPPPQDPVAQALSDFRGHLSMLGKSGIALMHRNLRHGALLPSKCTSRYFPEGRKSIANRLYPRLPKVHHVGVHLTLTTDMTREENLITATTRIWKRWKALREMLNARRKREGKLSLDYCAALEFQQSGSPHLHIFFPKLKYLAPHSDLQTAWGSHVWIKLAPAAVANYVLKYVTKLKPDHQHILWAAKARLYNVSRWFYTVPWTPSGEWIFLGLVYGTAIEKLSSLTASSPRSRDLFFSSDRDSIKLATWDSLCFPRLVPL